MNGMPIVDDAALLSQFIAGDMKAFDTIYRKYATSLYHQAYNRIGNREESLELVQDIFTSLWQKRDNLGHVSALRYYLFCSMRYLIYRHYRNHAIAQRHEKEFALLSAKVDNGNEEYQDLREAEELLEKAIASLPDRMQEAFRLRRQENLSLDSIASRMNVSRPVVEKYVSEATKRLRLSLGDLMLLVVLING